MVNEDSLLTAGHVQDMSGSTEQLRVSASLTIFLYPRSVVRVPEGILFLGRSNGSMSLWFAPHDSGNVRAGKFTGELLKEEDALFPAGILRCPLSHENAEAVRVLLPWTRPTVLGLDRSLGCGDRLGNANPGHLRALAGSGCRVILAQQSVRELERTNRQAEDVVDAATWAVLQEGYREGFGADADHLKTTEDIDRYARAGYTMYTLDVGAYVVIESGSMPLETVRARLADLPWDILRDNAENTVSRFADHPLEIAPGFTLRPSAEDVMRALLKYGGGIAHAARLTRHLDTRWASLAHEVELSVDETDVPTSVLEHAIIASELQRLGVKLVSLAPRFVGDFQKGIEYKGDLEEFRVAFVRHMQIAERFGPYKISIHSGSDKFAIYREIGAAGASRVHVKTAGTSWLEALRTIAMTDASLFRGVLAAACDAYAADRATYNVTGEVQALKAPAAYSADELAGLLDNDHARQILHVTYGSILRGANGHPPLREKIYACLGKNEDLHYRNIERHFRRHLTPLLGGK